MSEKQLTSCSCDEHRVLELATEMGQILLQSGAEIFRVEDTMRRTCEYFGVTSGNFFVLGNGIFATAEGSGSRPYARVRYVPVSGAQLDRIVAINQISREIADGKYEDIDEIERKVQEIKAMPSPSKSLSILCSAAAATSFCILFGGNVGDTVSAFLAGLLLYVFMTQLGQPHLSKIMRNIAGGAIVTAVCLAAYLLGLGQNLGPMISGGIIPLVPGVAFTNAIRDIGGGDYLSGTVRLLDAVWSFLCIAIGVGFVFGLYQIITGGVLL